MRLSLGFGYAIEIEYSDSGAPPGTPAGGMHLNNTVAWIRLLYTSCGKEFPESGCDWTQCLDRSRIKIRKLWENSEPFKGWEEAWYQTTGNREILFPDPNYVPYYKP